MGKKWLSIVAFCIHTAILAVISVPWTVYRAGLAAAQRPHWEFNVPSIAAFWLKKCCQLHFKTSPAAANRLPRWIIWACYIWPYYSSDEKAFSCLQSPVNILPCSVCCICRSKADTNIPKLLVSKHVYSGGPNSNIFHKGGVLDYDANKKYLRILRQDRHACETAGARKRAKKNRSRNRRRTMQREMRFYI